MNRPKHIPQNRRSPAYPDGTPIAQERLDALPEDGFRYEWWNGVLRVSPSASLPHQRCLLRFSSYWDMYFMNTQSGSIANDWNIEIPGRATFRPDFLLLL